MSQNMPMLGSRKSVDIVVYLFQTLQLEAKRLTIGEVALTQRILVEKYSVPEALATDLLKFLRRT